MRSGTCYRLGSSTRSPKRVPARPVNLWVAAPAPFVRFLQAFYAYAGDAGFGFAGRLEGGLVLRGKAAGPYHSCAASFC